MERDRGSGNGSVKRRPAERRAGAGRGQSRGRPQGHSRLRGWGLPGELHKLWRCPEPGTYHVEYGYSCMGYEIAGGLGVKLAMPEREVWVLLGDGSYLMMNSEIATSVHLRKKLNIVVLDNGGFGCIDRLQRSCGGASFNRLR
jgi:3D-(3,5/4)-trihydroxycyclohexane-1,2-dione acylhydrolase (decyclizing)